MLDKELTLFRIDQDDHVDFVELQIAASGIAEGAHDLPVGLAQIRIEVLEGIVHRAVENGLAAMRQEGARRRNGHLRDRTRSGDGLEITEMLDHRVAGERSKPRRRPVRQSPRLAALEALDVRRRKGLDIVEMTKEVAAPEAAPIFAIGHDLEAERFLLCDRALDGLVFDCLEIGD